jgi:hypothetical protein
MSSSDSYSGSYSDEFVITDQAAFGIACFGLLVFLLLEIIDRRGDRRV